MQYLNEFLTYVLGPGAAAFLGWFFGRRKASAEADATELDNVEKGLGIYRKIIEDVIKGQEEMRIELAAAKEKIAALEEDRERAKDENKGLRTENNNLRKRIGHLEKEIEELKKQQND